MKNTKSPGSPHVSGLLFGTTLASNPTDATQRAWTLSAVVVSNNVSLWPVRVLRDIASACFALQSSKM
eukprot:1340279-Rhodomonas_salina.1